MRGLSLAFSQMLKLLWLEEHEKYRVVDMSKHLTLEGHSGTVTGVVMGAEVIVSGGADRQVILWRGRMD